MILDIMNIGENCEMEKNEPQSTEDIKDCMIFSSTYKGYKKNIEFDRPDKTLGQWHIKKEYIPHIKFVYVYLNFSGHMLVKKYEVEKFEYSKKEKGWDNPTKYSFIFKRSEDIQKLYDEVVQGRQYRTSKEIENMKEIEDKDLNWRFKQASEAKSNYIHKEKKEKTSQELLVDAKKIHFPNKIVTPQDAKMLIEKVENGEDVKTVLENYFTSKKQT